MIALSGLTVIITRPLHQALALKSLVESEGAHSLLFPTLQIEVLNLTHNRLLKEIADQDMLIFTSRNAVDCLLRQSPIVKKSQVAAIGPGTAKALHHFNISVDILPVEKFDSENLLTCSALINVKNKRILIITGENGRDYLQDTLMARGAQVKKLTVYRRICPVVPRAVVLNLTKITRTIFVTTSVASLSNLNDIFSLHHQADWLRETPILVISDRMQQFALENKFSPQKLIQADNATDSAILERLIKWYANSPR